MNLSNAVLKIPKSYYMRHIKCKGFSLIRAAYVSFTFLSSSIIFITVEIIPFTDHPFHRIISIRRELFSRFIILFEDLFLVSIRELLPGTGGPSVRSGPDFSSKI